jgi:phospholipid/cholesterol/gamma-HCH transport system substrate-binding protein
MAENATEVIVGGAVLAAAIGFVVYAGNVAGITREPTSYPLTASFRSVDGVTVGTDVRLAGIKVGTVTAMALNPTTFFADLTFTVRQGIEVPDDSAVLISSEGLLGGTFVEIVPGGSPYNLDAGAEVEDTQGAVSLTTLLLKFVGGMGSGPDEGAAEPPAE